MFIQNSRDIKCVWPCSFCSGVGQPVHLAPSRQAYRRHLQLVHHMDIEHVQVGRVGSDRYVKLEGEELQKKLRRIRLSYMNKAERQDYYAQLRKQSETAHGVGNASTLAPLQDLAAAASSESGPAPVRRMTLNPPPHVVCEAKFAGYQPVDYDPSPCSSVSELSSGQDSSICLSDWDFDPPECSVEFQPWVEAEAEGIPEVEPCPAGTSGAPATSWECDSPRPPSTSPILVLSPLSRSPVHVSSPVSCSLYSSSPLPCSSHSPPSSVSGIPSSDDEPVEVEDHQSGRSSPSIAEAAASEALGPVDALVPVIVALVRSLPGAPIDAIASQVSASSPAVSRAEIRRLVTVAVTTEQLFASSLQQLVGASLIVDPSGSTAFALASAELVRVLARPM